MLDVLEPRILADPAVRYTMITARTGKNNRAEEKEEMTFGVSTYIVS